MTTQDIIGYDIFGEPIRKQRYFIEPPFSVLDTKGYLCSKRPKIERAKNAIDCT